MMCLWNGEYGKHDIESQYSSESGAKAHIERMERTYARYPGMVVGDFTCVKVEYDWGRRDQRWTVRCNNCGEEQYVYHAQDWRRGKGRSVVCKHCKELDEAEKIANKKKAQDEKRQEKENRTLDILWSSYFGWTVMEYDCGRDCYVVCDECGLGKNVNVDDLVAGRVVPCKHKAPTDYSSDTWIGKRNGHLTAIGRDGSLFIARCDCGAEISVRPVELFTRKTKRACGEPDCQYSSAVHKMYEKRKKEGIAYEKEVEQMLLDKGYNAKATQGVGDYGVDIIITNDDGTMTAVQCKKQTAPAGVGAVQEAYAGGRFYDCTKFAVVCDAGFSDQAYYMARKLGVYLCDGDFEFPDDVAKYASELLPTFKETRKSKKYYEINGEKKTLAEWCDEYGTDEEYVIRKYKDGVPLEEAVRMKRPQKPTYTVRGFTGTIEEICDNFGMLRATVDYRMKHRGMSLEEALFTQKYGAGGKNGS